MPTSITSLAILLFYLAGLIVFVLFYGKEEGTTRAYLGAFAALLIAFVLGAFYRITMIGAMVAATFYVANRKNRSRLWAVPAMFFGPLALLAIVLLPKRETSSLSLNSPSSPDCLNSPFHSSTGQ
jgi:hypothetical protein